MIELAIVAVVQADVQVHADLGVVKADAGVNAESELTVFTAADAMLS